MNNALTIDLEEYFHVSAYADRVQMHDWDSYPSRVANNTDLLLAMLEEHKCLATFFVLGWLAEKKPEVVARVSAAGHEIACHSLLHRKVFNLTPQQFRDDTRRAKAVIEDAVGKQIVGYRAPSFSITERSEWAVEILKQEGFCYDSSIFPVSHPSYGIPDAPRRPYWLNTPSGPILEYPMSTLSIAGIRAPIAGGAYLRLLPYWYTAWAIRSLNQAEELPACIYLHPWELDPEQPQLKSGITARVRHWFGISTVRQKLDKLLCDFKFQPLGTLVAQIQKSSVSVCGPSNQRADTTLNRDA